LTFDFFTILYFIITRKHFQVVASTVSAILNESERKKQAEFHAKIFADNNPRFDKSRFLVACNLVSSINVEEK